MCMLTMRQPLYSSVLEDCKVSLDSCYLEDPSAASQPDGGEDQRMRAEAYLFR